MEGGRKELSITQAGWEGFPREMLLSAGCETVPGQVTEDSSLEVRGNGMCWVRSGDTGPWEASAGEGLEEVGFQHNPIWGTPLYVIDKGLIPAQLGWSGQRSHGYSRTASPVHGMR